MLSAITRRLAEVEKGTRENAKRLAAVTTLLGLDGERDKDNDDGMLPTSSSASEVAEACRVAADGEVKAILLRHEGRLRTAEYKLNRVDNATTRQAKEIAELRRRLREAMADEADDDFDENGKRVPDDELGQDFAYNPMAPEFKPRPRDSAPDRQPPSSFCCSSSSAAAVRSRLVEIDPGARNVPPAEALALRGFAFSMATTAAVDQHSPMPPRSPRTVGAAGAGCGTPTSEGRDGGVTTESPNYAESASSELTTAIFHFDDIKEELMFYKNLFFKLEIELKRKEELLQNMADALYESPERRYIQKRKWFEHKIRLLNQDKRRRGEAIGKLIRCIEELKDRERADESLVTEGKYAMQAALKTRGWPQEERIKTTVLSLEADRVHIKLQRDVKNPSQQDEVQSECSEPIIG